ncbi:hypothetical protein DY000_02015832 [Brassica cretica]|uniref:Uncharacterized protein n=1 Tax=Brassica cretica TaxID=69181 RepID=A0ABQ7CMD5_BRACR|nr:hypothetical protein DY000_02015832 [Brassica cretica]
MEGSPYRKFSISRRKGGDPGTGPGKLHSGEPGFLIGGILGTGVPSSGDPEAGALHGVWRNSIPGYFFPNNMYAVASQRELRCRGEVDKGSAEAAIDTDRIPSIDFGRVSEQKRIKGDHQLSLIPHFSHGVKKIQNAQQMLLTVICKALSTTYC